MNVELLKFKIDESFKKYMLDNSEENLYEVIDDLKEALGEFESCIE